MAGGETLVALVPGTTARCSSALVGIGGPEPVGFGGGPPAFVSPLESVTAARVSSAFFLRRRNSARRRAMPSSMASDAGDGVGCCC